MKPNQAWKAAVGQLQMEMPKATFETWVRNTEVVTYEDGCFVIGAPNAYARDWLQSRLTSTVMRLLAGIMNRSVEVRFVVWQNTIEVPSEPEVVDNLNFEEEYGLESQELTPHPSLNSRYTFDSFVVGPSNRLAHAASKAVSEKPALAYNPLFLYGGAGLGKTHLLHAIGAAAHSQGLRVLYVSSEEFVNDLVAAIRTHQTPEFREKYRRPDVFLIDDIQFFINKETTQEEFFHTFNTLHGQDKQIVLTSDRPAKAMLSLEDRLRSRFEWGLSVDIQPPDLETRMAILRFKAERKGYQIPEEIFELIARRVPSNIRELEGALTRVAAFSDFSGIPVTAQLVETVLVDMLPRRKDVKPDEVLRKVSETFNVSLERILGRDRSRQVSLPRQVAMYLLRQDANISLPQIGDALGGRDHTTVMHGCEKIAELLEADDHLRRQIRDLREEIFGQELSRTGEAY